jgi:hypothetical protein
MSTVYPPLSNITMGYVNPHAGEVDGLYYGRRCWGHQFDTYISKCIVDVIESRAEVNPSKALQDPVVI